jgi:hypothetical protein
MLPVLAVVVATQGGRTLEATLASVAWAAERAVLDPAGLIPAGALPAGVRLTRDIGAVAALGEAPWLLLLAEGELAMPALCAAVGSWSRASGCGAAVLELDMSACASHCATVRCGWEAAHSRIVLDQALEPR